MHRTLPALIVLTLAACSSSGGSTSTSNGSATGQANGSSSTTGASTGTGAGNGTGSATGGVTGTANGGNGTTNGGNGSTTGGGAITVDNFNAAFNEAVCKFMLNCENEPSYAPYIEAYCALGYSYADYSDLPLAVDAGRISFDTAEATACVNGLSATTCSLLNIYPCIPFLDGTNGIVPPAGACYADSDCLSGGCSGNVANTCTAGTCAGLVAVGQPCDCMNCGNCDPDAGLSCLSSSSVCAAPGGVGQPCDDSTHAGCNLGLDCVGNVCASLPIAAGDPCNTREGECVSGSYCYEALGAMTGNCALKVAAGQPCGEDADHQASAFSVIDNECAGTNPICLGAGTLMDAGVATGVCSTLQDVSGSCTPPAASIDTSQSYNNGCFGALNCVSGTCVKPPSAGSPCATGAFECDITTSFCSSTTMNCTAYLAAGATCNPSDPSPCGPTGTCDSTQKICVGNLPPCSPSL